MRPFGFVGALVLFITGGAFAQSSTATTPAPASPLEPFKAMKGIWTVDMDGDGRSDGTVEYRVIAAGSAVAETLFKDTEHEMITVFHMDGDRLLCTHYCAAGNQPRLVAKSPTATRAAFEMIDATNLPDKNAMHMNAVVFEFIDADHVTSNWSSSQGGKQGEHASFVMSRAKSDTTPASVQAPAGAK